MRFPARTCCRVAGFGVGVVAGGPLAGALGGYLGDVMHDFIGDVLGNSDELGDAISGMVGSVVADSLPKPWVPDDDPEFNHDFRRAMVEALAISVEGGVVERYAKEVNAGSQKKELLKRSFSKVSAHLHRAFKPTVKKRDADGFMELFPGDVPDTDLLRLQEDGSEVSTEILGWWYDKVLAPVVVKECGSDLPHLGGEEEFRRQTVAALAEEFPPAFGRVLKDPKNERLRIATARIMMDSVLRTVRSTDGKLDGVADQLSAFIQSHKADADLSGQVIAGIDSLEGRMIRLQNSADRIEETGEDTNRRVQKIESALITLAPIQKYRQNLYERFRVHNTIGIPAVEDPKQKQGPDFIDELFVQPSYTESRMSPEDREAAVQRGESAVFALLNELEDGQRRVVLLADPGMGKSTLIQWLITGMTAPAPLKGATWLAKCLPVPIILREVVGALPPDAKEWTWSAVLDGFRQHRYDTTKPAMCAPLVADEEAWRDLLGSSQAWFLIDGLDEIGDPEKRRAMRDVIWEGFDAHPKARFLITSRVVGYDDAPVDATQVHKETRATRDGASDIASSISEWIDELQSDGRLVNLGEPGLRIYSAPREKSIFHELRISVASLLYLAPWDNGQQETFANHWFCLRMGKVDGPVRAREFVEAVRSHPSTGVIGRVPNLLLLMALLYRFRASLPHGRAKVYAGISQAYLDGIDAARRLNDRLLPYTLPEKERLLAIIAMNMQVRRAGDEEETTAEKERSEVLVSMSDLREWLCLEFGGKEDAVNVEEMEKFLQHIAARSGLLLPRGMQDGEEHFAFAHLSFQEFYAGCWLEREFRRLLNLKAGGDEEDDLLSSSAPVPVPPKPLAVEEADFAAFATQPVWREPLLFLAERLAESAADTQTFRKWAFPVRKDTPLTEEAQALLATMSVDPQVNFPPDQRRSFWRHLWTLHVKRERWWEPNKAAQQMLERSEFHAAAIDTLRAVVEEEQVAPLSLQGCSGVEDLGPLSGLTQLETLSLKGCIAAKDLRPLSGLMQLVRLSLKSCSGVEDLGPLSGLTQLKGLDLDDCIAMKDLGPLCGLTRLKWLELRGCIAVKDLGPLSGLRQLQWLNLGDCSGVGDLGPLSGLTQLKRLYLNSCVAVKDLRPLSGLTQLKELDLNSCIAVEDLGPLSGLTQLEVLDLNLCSGVKDLGALSRLAQLKRLYLKGCSGVAVAEVEGLKAMLPACRIVGP